MTNKQLLEHTNGNGNGNGKHHGNGNGHTATQVKDFTPIWVPPEPVVAKAPTPFIPNDQPVILERPSWWSHAFVWLIVGVTAFGVGWAALAPLDQSVPAPGKLEAEGATKEIKAPNGGVVREIFVKNGDRVKQGQILVTFDPTAPQADLDSLVKVREAILRENQFYSANVNGGNISGGSELATLTRLRSSLIAENQFLQAQINGTSLSGTGNGEFNANQRRLIEANRAEAQSREAAARLQIQELQEQRNQVQVQLAAASAQLPKDWERLASARQQLVKAQQQLITANQRLVTARAQLPNAEQRLATNKALLRTDNELLARIKPVAEEGAISALQLTRQEQQVLTRQNEMLNTQSAVLSSQTDISARQDEVSRIEVEIARSQSDISTRESEILNRQADINRFRAEENRLIVASEQAGQQWQNARALSEKDVRTKIADNQKRIAEIDTELGRLRLENQKRMAEIDGQILKAQQSVSYQELRAPVDGVVFDLGPKGPGYVVRSIDTEPVLKIVPADSLVAAGHLTNRDIGFVREGMPVECHVESFPSTEFGVLTGTVQSIGKDVLPPSQERPFYAFPVKVKLDRQTLFVNGREINLTSGMAVNCSIKTRKRTYLSIITEMFQKNVDTLENIR